MILGQPTKGEDRAKYRALTSSLDLGHPGQWPPKTTTWSSQVPFAIILNLNIIIVHVITFYNFILSSSEPGGAGDPLPRLGHPRVRRAFAFHRRWLSGLA